MSAVRWDVERDDSRWRIRRRANRLLDETGAGRRSFGDAPGELFEGAFGLSGGRLEGKVAIITGASRQSIMRLA